MVGYFDEEMLEFRFVDSSFAGLEGTLLVQDIVNQFWEIRIGSAFEEGEVDVAHLDDFCLDSGVEEI